MLFRWQALIIGSSVEEVVVPSIHSMSNLLGSSPEPGTRVTHASNGQFLMLEVGFVCVHVVLCMLAGHVYTCTSLHKKSETGRGVVWYGCGC